MLSIVDRSLVSGEDTHVDLPLLRVFENMLNSAPMMCPVCLRVLHACPICTFVPHCTSMQTVLMYASLQSHVHTECAILHCMTQNTVSQNGQYVSVETVSYVQYPLNRVCTSQQTRCQQSLVHGYVTTDLTLTMLVNTKRLNANNP